MLKKLLSFTFFFSFVCFTKTVCSQSLSDKVDSYVKEAMIERHIPGLSLAVIVDGVPVKVKGYGLSNIENNITVNPETVFQSASVLGLQLENTSPAASPDRCASL